jgi:hypothetical protein
MPQRLAATIAVITVFALGLSAFVSLPGRGDIKAAAADKTDWANCLACHDNPGADRHCSVT